MTRRRHIFGFMAVLALTAGALTACGASANPAPTPTPNPAPVATVPPVSSNSASPSRVDTGGDDMKEDPFVLGERIFKTDAAEGVGCSYCHGEDGRGNIGPNIRGKMPGDIRFALESLDVMSFIHLNQEEVEAVSEYLQWLATQP